MTKNSAPLAVAGTDTGMVEEKDWCTGDTLRLKATAHAFCLMHCALHTKSRVRLSLIFVGAEGKPIPTELRQEANALNEEIQLEDELTARRAS